MGLQAPSTMNLFSNTKKWRIMLYAGLEYSDEDKILPIWHDMHEEQNAAQRKHTLRAALCRESHTCHCYNIVVSMELVDDLNKHRFGDLNMLTYKDAH